jgi:ribosomal protein L18
VVGFVVDDLTAAVRELEAAGVELLGAKWTSAAAVGATFARRTATSTS